MIKRITTAAAALLLLSACGSTTEDRALSGGGIGAAAGAIVGAVTGLSVLEGAVIGALAGGLTGALTDEDSIDLGKPVWKSEGSGASAASGEVTGTQLVRRVQGGLSDLGYAPGPVDGVAGPKTTEAIRRYQGDHDLLVDGRASSELAVHIEVQAGG